MLNPIANLLLIELKLITFRIIDFQYQIQLLFTALGILIFNIRKVKIAHQSTKLALHKSVSPRRGSVY